MKRLSLLFLSIILQTTSLLAQNITFKHLMPEDGLSQVSVNSVCVDSLGMIWIATREGLNYYDGNTITVYRKKKGEPHSLFCNTVSRVISDGHKRLYLQCTEGLAMMDIATRKFKTITHAPIGAIRFNKQLYVGVENTVYAYDHELQHTVFTVLPSHTTISSIGFDGRGNMLIGTNNNGVYRRTKAGTMEHIIPRGSITDIYTDRENETWIGSWADGMYRMSVDGRVRNVRAEDHIGLQSNFVRTFCQDNLGYIWLGTFRGLQRLDKQSGAFQLYSADGKAGSLSNASIWSIAKDSQGTLWMGTYFGGVNYFNPEFEIYNYFRQGKSPAEGLSSPIVGSMTEDDQKHLWICTEGGGLNMYDRNTGQIKWFSLPSTPNIITHNNLKSIYYDKKRQCLWIGTHLGGLNRMDLKSGKITNYSRRDGDPHSLPSNIVRDIVPYGSKLILATQNGVCLFTPETGKCQQLLRRNKFSKYISVIPCITIDRKQQLWIGTERDGVFCYDMKRQKLYWYRHNEHNRHSLSSNNINKIYTDRRGNIWICTSGTGIDRYIPQTNSFENYDANKNGLASDCVYSICESSVSDNKMLVITNQGYSEFNLKEKHFQNFGRNNGFPLSAVNERALYMSKDGQVFLGGVNGMLFFNEKQLHNISKKYNIQFGKLFVNGKEVNPQDETGLLEQALEYTSKLVLKNNVKMFAIEIANSNHIEDNRARLVYQLEGYSKTWNELHEGQSVVSFTNLNPGTYTLICKSSRPEIQATKLEIRILPPWYKTWWAYLAYPFILGFIIWYFTSNYLERVNLYASLKYERKRASDIEEMNQSKLRFFTNISHEIRNPLTVIIGLSESMLGMDTFNPRVYSKLLSIHKSSMQLRDFISELLDFRKQEQGKMVIHPIELDLTSLVYETFLIYREYGVAKGIEVKLQCDAEHIIAKLDLLQMKKVINNLLANAIKHTPQGGDVSIVLSADERTFTLLVNNPGNPIPAEQIEKIFDRFYQVEQLELSSRELGTGIGLALVKGIVELHQGEIHVTSNATNGTSFIIKIPKGEITGQQQLMVQTLPVDTVLMPDTEEEKTEERKEETATILIVEDNETLLTMLQDLFRPYYKVLTAQDGEQGLAAVKEALPDIVLTDLVMPKMLGTELCRSIKRNPEICHIPVVLLTARTSVDNQVESLKIGADDYITKPFVASILLARCNNLINNRRMLQQRFSKSAEQQPDMLATNEIDKKLLERALKLIEENYADPNFNVDKFAREIGMSRTALFNKWKSLTSDTPMSFIQSYRLKKAASMLKAKPDLTIAEVSDKNGFSSARYFCKCFKDFYHIMPSKYRTEDTDN
uniref:histidine kinase n=1 Tax=Prevotella sp. GTC17253 TaxID=3236793 RepID=A0AB33IT60_9BACT